MAPQTRPVDPKQFGLPARTILMKTGKNTFEIVLERKSRLVMKDAHQILLKVKSIRELAPGAKVDLRISGPVCSKTVRFLTENDVDIVRSPVFPH